MVKCFGERVLVGKLQAYLFPPISTIPTSPHLLFNLWYKSIGWDTSGVPAGNKSCLGVPTGIDAARVCSGLPRQSKLDPSGKPAPSGRSRIDRSPADLPWKGVEMRVCSIRRVKFVCGYD